MTNIPGGRCQIERKGTRTLPLPGNKKIIIVWGQLEETNVCLYTYFIFTFTIPFKNSALPMKTNV